jgi:cytochrome P450
LLQDLVSRFTLDSATEFLFGYDVGSLSGGLPYPHYVTTGKTSSPSEEHPSSRFVTAFTEAQKILSFRMRFGIHWPLAEFWEDKLKKPIRVVHDFINPIVAQAIKRKRATEADLEKDDETLLEHLVNSTEDPITLRDEIMSLLVAGRDTVRWFLWLKRAVFIIKLLIDCEYVNVYSVYACRAPRGTPSPASGNFREDRTTEEAYL